MRDVGTRAERDLARALARLNVKELSEFLSALNMSTHEWPTVHSLIEYTHKHGGFDPHVEECQEPKMASTQGEPDEGFVYCKPKHGDYVEILCDGGLRVRGFAHSFYWGDDSSGIVAYRVINKEEA